jgi:hypothetical protein
VRRIEAGSDGKEKQENEHGENDGKSLAALAGSFFSFASHG